MSKVRKKNPLLAKADIVRLLAPLEIGRSTIYNILKTTDARGSAQHGGRGQSGRKRVLMSTVKRKMLVRAACAKVGVSLRV